MDLQKVMDILEAELLWGNEFLCHKMETVAASDLLSDVLSFTEAGSLLLTGLVNPQVIRTAEMLDICAICFVRGKEPDEATTELAMEKGVPLIHTRFSMYEACGKLYGNGLKPSFEAE